MKNLIDGVKITMRGTQYEISPLTFRQVRELKDKIARVTTVSNQMTDLEYDDFFDIVLAGMQRNYPDMTCELLEDILDLGNARKVLSALFGGHGVE